MRKTLVKLKMFGGIVGVVRFEKDIKGGCGLAAVVATCFECIT